MPLLISTNCHLPTNFLFGKDVPYSSTADLHSHTVSFQVFLSLSFLFSIINMTQLLMIFRPTQVWLKRATWHTLSKKLCIALQLLLLLFLYFSGILLPLLVKRLPLKLWRFKLVSAVWFSPVEDHWVSTVSREKQNFTLNLGAHVGKEHVFREGKGPWGSKLSLS